MATASAKQHPYRVKVIPPSEYHFLLSHLEENMLEYEGFTRKNSGSVKGGIRVLHGDTFNYAKYALEMAWKHLDDLKRADYGHYMSIVSGAEGQFLPIRLSTTGYASLNQHTSRQRSEFKNSDQIRRKATGKATDLHNSERSVFNWRNKLTSSEIMYHANGATSPGFDLFSEWTGINAAGNPDKKGRSGVIGYINLKYVLGSGNFAPNSAQDDENQPNSPDYEDSLNEDSSAITPINNLKNKKKKEECGKIENEAAKQQTEKTRHLGDQQDAESSQPDLQLNEQKKVDQPPGCAAPPPNSRYLNALALWGFLLARIYLPMLKSGRVRYNAAKSCDMPHFSGETGKKGVAAIEDILRTYSADTLKVAIEKQAEWLENDENRWIYTPGTFLKGDLLHGGLISAIRELVRPDMPDQIAEVPGESLPDEQRVNVLYGRILGLGCKNTRKHTFLGWYRKHGVDYLSRIVQAFQAEIHRRRGANAEIGKEFPQGNSAKFAKMVYYGHETLAEVMDTTKADLRKKLRSECKSDYWQQVIGQVKQLPIEDVRRLWRVSNEHLGYKMKDIAELSHDENAVLFAWSYTQLSTIDTKN